MDFSQIKKGVMFIKDNENGTHKYYNVCSCGETIETDNKWSVVKCEKCGNTNFLPPNYSDTKLKRMAMGGIYEILSKNNSGFVIQRIDVYAKLDFENMKFNFVQQPNIYKADFSFKRGDILVYKNDEKIYTTDYNLDCVFRGLDKDKLIDDISTPQNKDIFRIALNRFGAEDNERVNKMNRALRRLLKHPAIQILGAYGIKYECLDEIFYSVKDSDKTTPYEILNYPKYITELIRKYSIVLSTRNKNRLDILKNTFDSTNVKEYLKIFNEESEVVNGLACSQDLLTLWEDYGYKDICKLATYLARDVKLQQGIINPTDAITYLVDYVRMMTVLEHSYEKYPKSLKKVHDISLMNYKMVENEVKEKAFKDVVKLNSYEGLTYHDKVYSVIVPESVKDVIKEGDSLSHCVASYVDDIIKQKCKILFLRYKETLKESLVTIEVRGNSVRQVKGKFDRKPTCEEVEFVKKWSKEKNLDANCYDLKYYNVA